MSKIKKNQEKIRGTICILIIILSIFRIYYNNGIYAIFIGIIISFGLLFDEIEYKPCYLFFSIPYMYISKISLTQISLFTVFVAIYIIVVCINMIKEKKQININVLIVILSIISLTLIHGLSNQKFNFFDSISWIMNFGAIYLIIENTNKKELFYTYSRFFAVAVLFAGVIGIIAIKISPMYSFITLMTRTNTILVGQELSYRFSGLDLDPNYFALQSLVAIWILTITEKMEHKRIYRIVIAGLVVIGFLTISKMYLIAFTITGIIYILRTLPDILNKNKINIKKVVSITIIVCLIVIFFGEYIYTIFYTRINEIDSIEGLTTGRSEIWKNNIDYIAKNPNILIFGNGIGSQYLNSTATHSSYILAIYRLGMLGTIIYVYMILLINKNLKNKLYGYYNIKHNLILMIPLISILITCFALDSFDYDFFPYILYLSLFACDLKGERIDEYKKDIH